MQIETLKMRNFRNYTELTLSPYEGVNVMFGQNGSGKTNLLEAVHYCTLGRSHRSIQDREVIKKGEDRGACGAVVVRSTADHHKVRSEIAVQLNLTEQKRKQVYVNRKKVNKISDMMGIVRCVMFSPEDLMLVKDAPQTRRRYLDMLISQLSTEYFSALQRYQRALDQRSGMIRSYKHTGQIDDAIMDVFESQMAESMVIIIQKRKQLTDRLQAYAAKKYQSIAGRDHEEFHMRYLPCTEHVESIYEYARCQLKMHRKLDIIKGGSHFGIHREELALYLNDMEMKTFASQGQIRTAALAMKLAQLSLFREETHDEPILLLDDVMSELDMTRRTRLVKEVTGLQTFITCTDQSDIEGLDDLFTYHVSVNETGSAMISTEREPWRLIDQNAEEEPDFS